MGRQEDLEDGEEYDDETDLEEDYLEELAKQLLPEQRYGRVDLKQDQSQ